MTADLARRFAALHVPGAPLVLANVWDAATARIVARAGAPALATTSAAVAWSLGTSDGERLEASELIDVVGRIAAAVDVPVSADIEGGYADSVGALTGTIRAVIAAGAVGVNIEDTDFRHDGCLRSITDQSSRLNAARRAAEQDDVALFINARVDTYMLSIGAPGDRMAETLRRARAYIEAGANGIFVPGLSDLDTIEALAAQIAAPVNVLGGPGTPSIRQFGDAGAARVSLGPAVAQRAYATVADAVRDVYGSGSYAALAGGLGYDDLNGLFR